MLYEVHSISHVEPGPTELSVMTDGLFVLTSMVAINIPIKHLEYG